MYRFIRKAILGLALFACIAIFSACTREIPTPTPIPDPVATSKYIHFTEPAIEERVRAILEKPIGGITPEDVLTITHLTIRGRYIRDISDIAYFTNLVELDLSGNNIENIDALGNATNLTKLYLWNNKIENIDALRNVTKLTHLDLGYNDIEDFSPLSELTNLIDLNISQNELGETGLAPLSNLTNLETLNISRLGIRDLSSLASLAKLKSLNASVNSAVESLEPLMSLVNLETLDLTLSYMKVSNRDYSPLAQLPSLYSLDLCYTHVDLEELVPLTNIKKLNLSENSLDDIDPLAKLTNLEELIISTAENSMTNPLTDIAPLASLTNLRVLEITYTNVSDVSPLKDLTNLRELNLSNNVITDITPLENLTDLTHLMLHHNDIENLDVLQGHENLIGVSFNSKEKEMENTFRAWIPNLEYIYRMPATYDEPDMYDNLYRFMGLAESPTARGEYVPEKTPIYWAGYIYHHEEYQAYLESGTNRDDMPVPVRAVLMDESEGMVYGITGYENGEERPSGILMNAEYAAEAVDYIEKNGDMRMTLRDSADVHTYHPVSPENAHETEVVRIGEVYKTENSQIPDYSIALVKIEHSEQLSDYASYEPPYLPNFQHIDKGPTLLTGKWGSSNVGFIVEPPCGEKGTFHFTYEYEDDLPAITTLNGWLYDFSSHSADFSEFPPISTYDIREMTMPTDPQPPNDVRYGEPSFPMNVPENAPTELGGGYVFVGYLYDEVQYDAFLSDIDATYEERPDPVGTILFSHNGRAATVLWIESNVEKGYPAQSYTGTRENDVLIYESASGARLTGVDDFMERREYIPQESKYLATSGFPPGFSGTFSPFEGVNYTVRAMEPDMVYQFDTEWDLRYFQDSDIPDYFTRSPSYFEEYSDANNMEIAFSIELFDSQTLQDYYFAYRDGDVLRLKQARGCLYMPYEGDVVFSMYEKVKQYYYRD